MALLDTEVKTEPQSALAADPSDVSKVDRRTEVVPSDIHSDGDNSHPFKMTAADSAAATEMKATPVASPPLKLRGETEVVPLLPGIGVGTAQIKREGRSPSPARTMVANGTFKHQEMTRYLSFIFKYLLWGDIYVYKICYRVTIHDIPNLPSTPKQRLFLRHAPHT